MAHVPLFKRELIDMDNPKYKTIDEYVSAAAKEVQPVLQELRRVIHEAAPAAQEVISYNMPAFRQNGILVYFAAFKNHIGFFPTSSGVAAFTKELVTYETAKGTVRFPLDRAIPYDLVAKIVKFRVQENLNKKRNEPGW
jgi:uncharacterized protein YdhG (YjbR/CyaY superfamily)